MKKTITVEVTKEVDFKTLQVDAGVRYWEDSEVNNVEDTEGTLIPFREGDRWKPTINVETGQIIGWPQGTTANIHYKVCDDGSYYLKDEKGETVLEKHGYVPRIMFPSESGYGDYIIMSIDEDGFIEDFGFYLQGFINEDIQD